MFVYNFRSQTRIFIRLSIIIDTRLWTWSTLREVIFIVVALEINKNLLATATSYASLGNKMCTIKEAVRDIRYIRYSFGGQGIN